MSAGWIDAVALVETADAPLFEHLLGRHVPGADATYRTGERLGVELATEEDEALFRLALLGETTAREILHVAGLLYLVAPRLSDEVRGYIDQGLFDGDAAPLTVARLEVRDEGVLRRLREALGAECPALADQPIVLCTG